MEYSNPEIPENINTTKEHPLKEFFILSGGIIGCIVVAVLVLSLLAETLAARIPFSGSSTNLVAIFCSMENGIRAASVAFLMEYSNPEIPENINTTKEHPLKEFFRRGDDWFPKYSYD